MLLRKSSIWALSIGIKLKFRPTIARVKNPSDGYLKRSRSVLWLAMIEENLGYEFFESFSIDETSI